MRGVALEVSKAQMLQGLKCGTGKLVRFGRGFLSSLNCSMEARRPVKTSGEKWHVEDTVQERVYQRVSSSALLGTGIGCKVL